MRPTPSDPASLLSATAPRPPKSENTKSPTAPVSPSEPSSNQPVVFFLADEAAMQASATASSSSGSTFGVRSMSESSPSLKTPTPREHEPKYAIEEEETRSAAGTEEGEEEEGDEDGEIDTLDGSQSLASYRSYGEYMSSVASPELPTTPVLAAVEPEDATDAGQGGNKGKGRDQEVMMPEAPVPPQFIMPEITMPSRRPFTERGKRIGRLKILIAGDSGIGKTSLIKSIVQTCEDIVHVDPVASSPVSLTRTGSRQSSIFGRRHGETAEPTRGITEVFASTRPYPHWYNEIDETKVLRRKSRNGFEEQIIERNLCFVDTPGYGSGTSFLECIEPVVKYVESQFEKTHNTLFAGDGDLMPLLAGAGTHHVDIVFYVVLHRLKPVDIEFIRRLTPFTAVLPVIAKSDTLTPQQAHHLKLSILSDLRAASIRPFLFGTTASDLLRRDPSDPPLAPFAISSLPTSDADNMDASVLMSPDYVPPLLDTELSHLIDTVFDPDHLPWLKHSSAKKFLAWRRTHSRLPSPAASFSTLASSSHSPAPENSYALARLADHTQREELRAKARLSRWAHGLQKSLNAEKERYERLARGERAVWLTERLNECIHDGQLVPVGAVKRDTGGGVEAKLDRRDPIGVLRWREGVGRRVLVVVKVAGLGGLVGAVGVWVLGRMGGGAVLGVVV